MRNYYIAGNWKMHKKREEAGELARELVKGLEDCGHTVMIAPPFTALTEVAEIVKGTNILLGAQNVSIAEQGAHTGEISPIMLKDCGVDVVIIGHSERRLLYGETDDMINKKIKLALSHGFDVIFCVGETLDQREAGEAESVVTGQVKKGLSGIGESDPGGITLAYEPVWAIGTGRTATPEDADAIHGVIRSLLGDLYSPSIGDSMVIQYGGSVKPDNVKSLMSMENIDGALVGGAALKAETFIPIAKFDL